MNISRERFESNEEYIQALKSEDVMKLSRRQLQDLANHHMENAYENKDWDQVRTAFRYQDLAINMAGSAGEVAKQAVSIILQVLPDDEEAEKIDRLLGEMQKQSQLRGRNIADRMNARHEQGEAGGE